MSADPHLRIVPPPSSNERPRLEGGQIEDHFGPVCPWARLPEGAYWLRVDGWVIRPFRRVSRDKLQGAEERERDWRFIVHCTVVGVDETDPAAPAARSALFHHELDHRRRPKIPHGFRVAVGETSGRWRVPRGGTLWSLFAATGTRIDTLTPEDADRLLGWHLLSRTHVPTRRASKKPGLPGPRIPEALLYSWGGAVEAVRGPHQP
jgi:hypothetical protein